jgi:hypothetical protein
MTPSKSNEGLHKGPERKASRKADHEALALLERTGTTKEVLEELHAPFALRD